MQEKSVNCVKIVVKKFIVESYWTLGKIVEIVFSLRIYVFLFISLCIYMIYMFIYEKSQKIYKKTHRLYAICNVILCFLIYMIIGFLVVDIMSMVISIDVYSYIFAIVNLIN